MNAKLNLAIITIAALALLAWPQWITDECAEGRVVRVVRSPDATFSYLGEETVVRDIPKS